MAEEDFHLDSQSYDNAIKSFEKTSFYPSNILTECPKFRILVVGQTGSGKSTLCSKVFNVSKDDGEVKEPADFGIRKHSRGTLIHQVWKEITFPGQNEEIVLHDSGGFEAGDTTGLEEIRKFIKDRLSRTVLAEQLHCIWYCIPLTGHRHIQEAEKKFFNDFDLGDIPVVAVFTHFDTIENEYEFKLMKQHQRERRGAPLPEDLADKANAQAVREYDETHRRNLEEIVGPHSKVAIQRVAMPPEETGTNSSGEPLNAQGVNKLINTTFDMLTKEGLRRLWISAQQQSAKLKREQAIATSMLHFEKVNTRNSIPLIPFLGGEAFSSSFDEIYSAVTRIYGLIDPGRVMQKTSTRKRIFEACLKFSASRRIAYRTGLAVNFLGPLTAPLITIALLKMIAGVIMIHDRLFWKQRDKAGLLLTPESVGEICSNFSSSAAREHVQYHLEGSIHHFNYPNRDHCEEKLRMALEGQKLWTR